ncbi:hypothetical protein BKA65DRAFT_566553 [Rhexocercosporidium sp. MPI-PUGE-AT-0058]|nr:hypothetical protein BKA65DRAFT_566553 [Rhexocercosporidium sp. MPI-PUGE-AT-0058]
MISSSSTIALVFGLAAVAKAHYTLQFPEPIGPYNDEQLTNGPCDGYDPTTASNFQDWPWRGEAVTLLTTHPVVTWSFNVALFSSVSKSQSSFMPMTEDIKQNNGTGYLCLGQVPGKKEWVGEKAIVQVIQHAPDGDLTSANTTKCIAVTFTDAAADVTGGGTCKNDSGIAKKPYDIFYLPGTGSDLNSGETTTSRTTTAGPTSSSSTSGPTGTGTDTRIITASTTSGVVGTGTGTPSSAGPGTTSTASMHTGMTTSPTISKSASGTAATNSTSTTGATTSTPPVLTGASGKTYAGFTLDFVGITFAVAFMAFGLHNVNMSYMTNKNEIVPNMVQHAAGVTTQVPDAEAHINPTQELVI